MMMAVHFLSIRILSFRIGFIPSFHRHHYPLFRLSRPCASLFTSSSLTRHPCGEASHLCLVVLSPPSACLPAFSKWPFDHHVVSLRRCVSSSCHLPDTSSLSSPLLPLSYQLFAIGTPPSDSVDAFVTWRRRHHVADRKSVV